MRWGVAGDDGEKKGGREGMGTADSAGKRKEGRVDVDGEHIHPNLARAMIEVKITGCAVEAGQLAHQNPYDISCLLVYVSFQRGHLPNFGAETLQRACLPTREAHKITPPCRHPNRTRPTDPRDFSDRRCLIGTPMKRRSL